MVYVDIYVCDISFPFALKISQMDVLHEVEMGGQDRHLVNAFFFLMRIFIPPKHILDSSMSEVRVIYPGNISFLKRRCQKQC